MNIRRQVYELTAEDLEKYPVWEYASDEESEPSQDEATVRPVEFLTPFDASDGRFLVRATFTANDGTEYFGYLTPSKDADDLGCTQPQIVTADGQVGFWFGIMKPTEEWINAAYRKLGKARAGVFPISFETAVALVNGPIRGKVSGFSYLTSTKDWLTRKVKQVVEEVR